LDGFIGLTPDCVDHVAFPSEACLFDIQGGGAQADVVRVLSVDVLFASCGARATKYFQRSTLNFTMYFMSYSL
jgi:hypothetical protein